MSKTAYRIIVNGQALSFMNLATQKSSVLCYMDKEEAIRGVIQFENIFGRGKVSYQEVELINCPEDVKQPTLNNIPKGYNPEFPNK